MAADKRTKEWKILEDILNTAEGTPQLAIWFKKLDSITLQVAALFPEESRQWLYWKREQVAYDYFSQYFPVLEEIPRRPEPPSSIRSRNQVGLSTGPGQHPQPIASFLGVGYGQQQRQQYPVDAANVHHGAYTAGSQYPSYPPYTSPGPPDMHSPSSYTPAALYEQPRRMPHGGRKAAPPTVAAAAARGAPPSRIIDIAPVKTAQPIQKTQKEQSRNDRLGWGVLTLGVDTNGNPRHSIVVPESYNSYLIGSGGKCIREVKAHFKDEFRIEARKNERRNNQNRWLVQPPTMSEKFSAKSIEEVTIFLDAYAAELDYNSRKQLRLPFADYFLKNVFLVPGFISKRAQLTRPLDSSEMNIEVTEKNKSKSKIEEIEEDEEGEEYDPKKNPPLFDLSDVDKEVERLDNLTLGGNRYQVLAAKDEENDKFPYLRHDGVLVFPAEGEFKGDLPDMPMQDGKPILWKHRQLRKRYTVDKITAKQVEAANNLVEKEYAVSPPSAEFGRWDEDVEDNEVMLKNQRIQNSMKQTWFKDPVTGKFWTWALFSEAQKENAKKMATLEASMKDYEAVSEKLIAEGWTPPSGIKLPIKKVSEISPNAKKGSAVTKHEEAGHAAVTTRAKSTKKLKSAEKKADQEPDQEDAEQSNASSWDLVAVLVNSRRYLAAYFEATEYPLLSRR